MIREILPDCGGQASERAVGMYRMWHCFDCGLEFSLKSRSEPKVCPSCLKPYRALPDDVKLAKVIDWVYRFGSPDTIAKMKRVLQDD